MFANLKDQRPKTKDLSLRAEKGFTLIELSIVIVIIGLIVAGVVGGQNLVRQSKVRGIITDYQQISTAMRAFKLEYSHLPGDMPNAADYWVGAYEGDGNGFIDYGSNEWRYGFQHLGLAKVLPGNFAINQGYVDSFGNYAHLGANNNQYQRPKFNMIVFEGDRQYGNPQPGFLTAKETFSIDNKMDDADPTDGNFIATAYGPYPSCLSGGWGGAIGSVNYVLSSSSTSCKPQFVCSKGRRGCVP